MGAEALSGVTYGGIGQRTGLPPTPEEYDNIARALEGAAKYAKHWASLRHRAREPLREPPRQHRLAGQVADREGGRGQHLHPPRHLPHEHRGEGRRERHLGRPRAPPLHPPIESDRGTPGEGTCDWDEVYATLAAIGFKGGLAMESFINMPPEVAYGLAVWRPVANSFEEVMDRGLPFLRNKARQYRLI
jgi:D-psicose/D-tagatose/L-ribulose 3-epimerase